MDAWQQEVVVLVVMGWLGLFSGRDTCRYLSGICLCILLCKRFIVYEPSLWSGYIEMWQITIYDNMISLLSLHVARLECIGQNSFLRFLGNPGRRVERSTNVRVLPCTTNMSMCLQQSSLHQIGITWEETWGIPDNERTYYLVLLLCAQIAIIAVAICESIIGSRVLGLINGNFVQPVMS